MSRIPERPEPRVWQPEKTLFDRVYDAFILFVLFASGMAMLALAYVLVAGGG